MVVAWEEDLVVEDNQRANSYDNQRSENKLDIQNFLTWKRDPVTLAMMRFLKDVRNVTERCMLDPSTMLADRGQIDYARQLGMRDGIDMILELELDDIQEEDENEEEVSSGRT